MEMQRPNAKPLSPQDLERLKTLKSAVERALEDGKFSMAEVENIKSIIWSDGKVSYEELRTVHETIKSVMGDVPPEIDWVRNAG